MENISTAISHSGNTSTHQEDIQEDIKLFKDTINSKFFENQSPKWKMEKELLVHLLHEIVYRYRICIHNATMVDGKPQLGVHIENEKPQEVGGCLTQDEKDEQFNDLLRHIV